MRAILVNLEVSPVLDSALQCALLVGRRFGSYIEGLHMRPGQPDIIAAGALMVAEQHRIWSLSLQREARERAERARNLVRGGSWPTTGCRALRDRSTGTGICADWRIEVSSGHGAIGWAGCSTSR